MYTLINYVIVKGRKTEIERKVFHSFHDAAWTGDLFVTMAIFENKTAISEIYDDTGLLQTIRF